MRPWELLYGKFNSNKENILSKLKDYQITSSRDFKTGQECIYISQALNQQHLEQIGNILREALNKKMFEAAQVGKNVNIKLDNGFLLILEKINLLDVHRHLLQDTTEYFHKLSIKTAEYHTYSQISSLDGTKSIAISGTQDKLGQISGRFHLRIDDPYDKKYFRDTENSGLNPKFDKGSHGLTFFLHNKQVKKLLDNVNNENEYAKVNYVPYHMLGINGKNCADFTKDLVKNTVNDFSWFELYDTSKLDLRDKGILYLYLNTYGGYFSFTTLTNFPALLDVGLHHFTNKGLWENIYDIITTFKTNLLTHNNLLTEELNQSNYFGNTPFYDALRLGNLDLAKKYLEAGSNVNITNNKKETALHLVAKLPASEKKHTLLKEIISKTINVDLPDLYDEFTPLSFAVLAEDDKAAEMLIEAGANPKFINSVKNNLVTIAIDNKTFETIDVLYKVAPELVLYDNMTRQIPICHIATLENPNKIIPDFDKIWPEFSHLCKTPEQIALMFDKVEYDV